MSRQYSSLSINLAHRAILVKFAKACECSWARMGSIIESYAGLCLWLTPASDTQTGPHGDHPRDDQARHRRPETTSHNTIKPRKALLLRVETAVDRSLPRVLRSCIDRHTRHCHGSSCSRYRCLSQPHHSALLNKTSHDFQLSLAAFQNAQKLSVERQRNVVQVVKQTAGEHDGATGGASSGPSGPSGSPGSPRLQQTQLQIKYVCPFWLDPLGI